MKWLPPELNNHPLSEQIFMKHGLVKIRYLPVLLVLLGFLTHSLPAHGEHAGKKLLDEAKSRVRALDFSARNLEGKWIRLRKLRGQVVFLNFWATWCLPCREEMPAMERLQQKLEGRPFRILAVNIQEPHLLVKKFVEDLGLTFTVLMDSKGKISQDYRAVNLPVTYIINKKGYIIGRAIGPRVWDSPAALHLFEEMLGEDKKAP